MTKWPAGGVCILMCKLLSSFLSELDFTMFPETEVIAANLLLDKRKMITVICAYLPPNLAIEPFRKTLLCINKLCSPDGSVILVGDFNLPAIDWSNMSSPLDAKNIDFLNLCSTFGLTQYVTEPTRLCNILDLVLSNDHMLISDCTVGVPFD